MMYLWVAMGSALGGVARYGLTRLMVQTSAQFPWSTVCVNILGCFAIGFFGTLTLAGGRYAVPERARVFVMVGVCGGFTTFSSFSLQTYDLLRSAVGAGRSATWRFQWCFAWRRWLRGIAWRSGPVRLWL